MSRYSRDLRQQQRSRLLERLRNHSPPQPAAPAQTEPFNLAGLPGELRSLIWRFALANETPRIAEVGWQHACILGEEVISGAGPEPDGRSKWSYLPRLRYPQHFRPPAILQVNREARGEALHQLVRFNERKGHRWFYLNPERDTLHICALYYDYFPDLKTVRHDKPETQGFDFFAAAPDEFYVPVYHDWEPVDWKRFVVPQSQCPGDPRTCECPVLEWPDLPAVPEDPEKMDGRWLTDEEADAETALEWSIRYAERDIARHHAKFGETSDERFVKLRDPAPLARLGSVRFCPLCISQNGIHKSVD